MNTAGVWILAFVDGIGPVLAIRAQGTLRDRKVKRVQQFSAQHGELKLRLPPAARCIHLEVVFLSLQHRVLHKPVVLECQSHRVIEREERGSDIIDRGDLLLLAECQFRRCSDQERENQEQAFPRDRLTRCS